MLEFELLEDLYLSWRLIICLRPIVEIMYFSPYFLKLLWIKHSSSCFSMYSTGYWWVSQSIYYPSNLLHRHAASLTPSLPENFTEVKQVFTVIPPYNWKETLFFHGHGATHNNTAAWYIGLSWIPTPGAFVLILVLSPPPSCHWRFTWLCPGVLCYALV